jgi:hypothetical protein
MKNITKIATKNDRSRNLKKKDGRKKTTGQKRQEYIDHDARVT